MLRKNILQFFNIILIVHVSRAVCYEVNAIARTVTSYLEKYESYRDVVMIHLKVPEDTLFASFKFVAEETQLSIFGCTFRNISLYMKYGSPPAINPEGAPFPKNFKNITRSQIYNLEMLSDKQESYINISSPEPGPYYITTFLSYSDPKYNAIQQEGVESKAIAKECSLFKSTSFISCCPNLVCETFQEDYYNSGSSVYIHKTSKYFFYY